MTRKRTTTWWAAGQQNEISVKRFNAPFRKTNTSHLINCTKPRKLHAGVPSGNSRAGRARTRRCVGKVRAAAPSPWFACTFFGATGPRNPSGLRIARPERCFFQHDKRVTGVYDLQPFSSQRNWCRGAWGYNRCSTVPGLWDNEGRPQALKQRSRPGRMTSACFRFKTARLK